VNPPFWPKSLLSQMLLAVGFALLLAQGIGAILVYRAQAERRELTLVHTAAFRLLSASRGDDEGNHGDGPRRLRAPRDADGPRGYRVERGEASPLHLGERRDAETEAGLRSVLADQDMRVGDLVVARRAIADDPVALARQQRRFERFGRGDRRPRPDQVLVAGMKTPEGQWLTARVTVPPGERETVITLIGQTLLIYVVLVSAIALILRRITRPLAALTTRLERFAETRSIDGQLDPEGPDDVRRLIVAHNAMEARIVSLLDEKDVMLGAIGHDLKTPLAALRVRIESVENDTERERMAATIEDITRSLDDILSLARVGRPSDPREQSELSALVASVVEEFEDMGEPVELGDTVRIALPLRSTWLRRALRNLTGNALRYGKRARVSVAREGSWAAVRIEDDGPGIPDSDIAAMMEPFTRGEPSRNTETGGAGLGLTLARAIADQHGGSLELVNRRGADGVVEGLTATLRLPI
jgi:signal transduction histidine kinase